MVLTGAFPKPHNVAIVTSGWDSVAGDYMRKRVKTHGNEPWEHVALYDLLKDPSRNEQLKHGADCTDPLTIVAVYVQDDFANLICSHVNDLLGCHQVGGGTLIDAECKSGYHRASTYGETLKVGLNAITDADGIKIFNAQTFPLHRHTHPPSIEQQVNMAVKWTTDPWGMTPLTNIYDPTALWAYEACLARPASMSNFNIIWDFVSGICERLQGQLLPHEPPAAPPQTPPAPPPPPAPVRMAKKMKRDSASSSHSHASAGSSTHAPSAPGRVLKSVKRESDEAIDETVAHSAHQYQATDIDYPAWVNIDCDVDIAIAWADELYEQDVDKSAQKELFALAQSSPNGRLAAYSVMTKVFKKESDGKVIWNPSAFIHTGVMNYWNKAGWGS